jgi:hypothetical protein
VTKLNVPQGAPQAIARIKNNVRLLAMMTTSHIMGD